MPSTTLTNTEKISSNDRRVVGPQPDNSTPTGSTPTGSVTNAQLAPMPANAVKSNATGASAVPADLVMSASTILARLSSGNIIAATVAQVKTLLAYAVGDLASIAGNSFVGNSTGSSAAPSAMSAASAAATIAGTTPYTGSVALAKLTPTGANGSLTVVNGLITAYSAPT